jgi:hypothetical protein
MGRSAEAVMNRFARWIALLALGLPTSGCAILGGGPAERTNGGSTLTQAATEAKEDARGKHRGLDVGDRVPQASGGVEVAAEQGDDDSDGSAPEPAPPPAPKAAGPKPHWVLGAVGGGGGLGGTEFEGFGLGGVDIGAFTTPRLRFDLGLLALSPNLTATSVAGQGLKDELELAADVSARFYLTPPHTFLGIYPLVGVRIGTLFWSYRNPVTVTADGGPKTIEDDYLDYLALYGGLGVSLAQTRHFSTGLNFTTGVHLYDQTTSEGFRNDLFPTNGYTQIAFEVMYKF